MNSEQLFRFDAQQSNLSMLRQLQSKQIQDSIIQLLEDQNSDNYQYNLLQNSPQNQIKSTKPYSNNILNKFTEKENQRQKQQNHKSSKKIKKNEKNQNKQEKLKRNRESVRNCRERRKQYIKILQNMLQEKDKKISELQTQLQQIQLERDRLKNTDKIYINSFLQAEEQCKQKIIKAYQQNSQNFLKNILNEYRERFGPAGKDRINLLNYHMSQIVQNLLGDKQKYLINCFVKGRHIFGSNNRQIQLQMLKSSNWDKVQHQKVMKTYKPILQKDLQAFNIQIQNFYNTYVKLRQICNNFQKVFSVVKNEYKDEDIARNYIWFQENKHRKQLNLKGQWYQVFKGSEQSIIKNLKKQKKY